MRNIAAKAGVHVTTVSLALRNHPSLPAATCERIQKLAKEMDYRPDPMLTALGIYRRSAQPATRLSTVAYLGCYKKPDLETLGIVTYTMWEGCRQRCRELGYHLEYIWIKEPDISAVRWNKILETRNPAGIIIGPMPKGRSHLRIDLSRFSAIKIEQALVWPRLHAVGNNQYKCIQLAIRQAHRLGYRRMGLAMRQAYDEQVDRLWSAGVLAERQHYPVKDWVSPHLPREWSLASFRKWMKEERPEVILSHQYNRIPLYLKELGYRIPKDVGFIDLDLHDFSGMRAGIKQNHFALGAVAIDQLAVLIQHNERGIPPVPQVTLLEGSWIPGATIMHR